VEDIRGLYDTSLEVVSLDSDDDVYTDSSVEFVVEGFEDDFDWSELKVDAVYSEEDEELELKVYLPNIGREPDYRYETEFTIGNKTFKKDFKYDEDEEELSFSFDTPMDEDDIESDYEVDFEVYNIDLDDEKVGDEEIEFDVEMISQEDDLDWDKITATGIYDEDRERLSITLELDNIKTEPSGKYTSFMEFEREDYDERFSYDDDKEALIAEYSIKIDEDDV
jgi:hypothetical protein